MNSTTTGYLVVLFLGVAVGMAIEEFLLQPWREAEVVVQPAAPVAAQDPDPAVRRKIERAFVNEANRQATRRAASQPAGAEHAWPKLLVEEPLFDFGERESGEKVDHTFILRNVGTAPLKIMKVMPIDGQTLARAMAMEIAPGDQAELSVTFDLAHKTGRKIRQVLVQSNDPTQPVLRLAVIGTVVPK